MSAYHRSIVDQKILINALGAAIGGGAHHLTSLLPMLGRTRPNWEFVVLTRERLQIAEVDENVVMRPVPDRVARGTMLRTAFDLTYLPISALASRSTVLVSLTNFGPIWSAVPHISLQQNSKFFCPAYLDRISGAEKRDTALRKRLLESSARHASLVVVPTQAMAEMLRRSCPSIAPERIRVLLHGFEHPSASSGNGHFRLKADRGAVKIFYPSGTGRHRGLDIVPKLLAAFREKHSEFVFLTTVSEAEGPDVYREFREDVDRHQVQGNVEYLGRISHEKINAVYGQSDIVLYPSLCESFGFPMVEAMSHGLPIVAADTAVNREICGDAALYYPPLDPDAGAEALFRALDSGIADKLSQGARRRLGSFDWSWRRYAEEFCSTIEEVT